MFSFACDSPSNPLYLETVEERLVILYTTGSLHTDSLSLSLYLSISPLSLYRFNYYDCLVIPVASIASTFPWEKVSLLVEYHPLGTSLFPSGQQPTSLRLREWVILKTVRDISVASLAKSGLYSVSNITTRYV